MSFCCRRWVSIRFYALDLWRHSMHARSFSFGLVCTTTCDYVWIERVFRLRKYRLFFPSTYFQYITHHHDGFCPSHCIKPEFVFVRRRPLAVCALRPARVHLHLLQLSGTQRPHRRRRLQVGRSGSGQRNFKHEAQGLQGHANGLFIHNSTIVHRYKKSSLLSTKYIYFRVIS